MRAVSNLVAKHHWFEHLHVRTERHHVDNRAFDAVDTKSCIQPTIVSGGRPSPYAQRLQSTEHRSQPLTFGSNTDSSSAHLALVRPRFAGCRLPATLNNELGCVPVE
jgi:hypothetical protein